MTKEWKPRIVAFFCNWCTYTAADLAGVSRLKYAANIHSEIFGFSATVPRLPSR